jgi:hypothetical protein
MTLHPPFIITARLLPGLRIGDAFLNLDGCVRDGERMAAKMILDLPDGTEYVDQSMRSGHGGFESVVAIFETYISFLEAAVESYEAKGLEGENSRLFPEHVVQWAAGADIGSARSDLTDEDGNVRDALIKA